MEGPARLVVEESTFVAVVGEVEECPSPSSSEVRQKVLDLSECA